MRPTIRPRTVALAVVLVALTVTPGLVLHLIGRAEAPPPRPPIVVRPLALPSPPRPAAAAPAVVTTRPTRVAEPPAGPVRLASDAVVRSLASGLSSHPEVARWLVADGLLRRFVAAVDLVAGGYSPREELALLRPVAPFVVRRRAVAEGERLVIGAASFRRYDLATEVVASLDVAAAAAVYRELSDDLEAVHREVSWSALPFSDRLLAAIDHLLAAPLPEGDLEVTAGVLSWVYADPDLERLSDAQRHLIRTGPRNQARLQHTLRALRAALVAPPDQPAPAQVAEAAVAAPAPEVANASAPLTNEATAGALP